MKGMVCAFCGATLWGLSSVCSDYLMSAHGMPPLALSAIRMLTAAVLFAIFAAVRYRAEVARMLADRTSIRSLVVFGIAGLYACQATYIISISCTNAGTATVMQSLNIVFIPIATWLMRRAKLSWAEISGAALAFCSVLALATQGDLATLSMPLAGLVWGLINGVTESFYVMYPARLFDKWGSMPVTAAGMVVGSVAALVVWLIAGAVDPASAQALATCMAGLDTVGWLALGGVCVVGTFIAFALFLYGVAIVGPVKSSLLGAMEPISSAGLCCLLLGTQFTGWDWLGLALMVGTIFLVTLGSPRKS